MDRTPDDMILIQGVGRSSEVHASGRHCETAFVEIGSITKTFTAALCGALVARGTLTLDTRVSDILATPATGISLRHLVEHTSGLPRLPPGVRGWRKDPYAHLDEARFGLVIRRLDTHRGGLPGLKRVYSNFGYAVLGAALARAAGTSWIEAVRQHVTGPLELPDEVLLADEVPQGRALLAEGRLGHPRAPWTLGAVAPAGGLWTTPRALGDYTRKVLLERALDRPLGWQFTDGADWHDGGTRDAVAFAGARPGSGAWTVVHALRRPLHEVDAIGLAALDDGRPA